MSVSAIAARKLPYNDILLPNASTVSAADGYHTRNQGETDSELSQRLVAELEAEFLRLGPENIISFM
jgi:adenosylmethionine-8-amino-7-oxononanoate aminotransferase